MGDGNMCEPMHRVDVVVVGAGVSGLCAVKYCLQQRLSVVALEKAGCAGGLWRPGGAPWQSLRTNLSRYTCSFSDFDWPENAPLFPTAGELFDYIQSYARKFGLLEHVRCRCEVVSACLHPADGNAWTVTYRDDAGISHSLRSRFLMVCSGFFASPVIPDSIPRSGFAGRTMHSEEYSTPEGFAGKRVLVVGNSFSGADICAELTSTAAEVHNAVRGSKWIFGRDLLQPPFKRPLPVDLLFYSRQSVARKRTVPAAERNQGTNAWFEELLGLPSAVHPLLTAPSGPAPAAVSITDEYLAKVSAGRILLHPPLVRLEGHRAVFSDESSVEVDEVIFATGYRPDLRFLLQRQEEQHGDGDEDDGVKTLNLCEILEYRPNDMLLPVILHLHTLHPALPTLGFVGMYKGPYFAVMELQARWLASLFSGSVPFPSEQEFADGLQAMREVRDSAQRPQFAADYAVMAESIAEHLRVGPGSAASDPQHALHELLFAGPLLPAHYRMTPDQASSEEHVPSVIKEVHELLKSSR